MMLRSLRRLVGLTNDLPSRSESGKKRAKQPSRARLGVEELEDRCPVCGIPPTAFDDEYWMTAGDTLIVPFITGVLANDSGGGPGGDGDTDPCGIYLHAELVEGPSGGTLSLNPDGSFNFTKESAGGVTFTYTACDELNYCSIVATVNIYVQKAPAKIRFLQDRGILNLLWPSSGTWGQPWWRADGAFYSSSSEIIGTSGVSSLDTPPAWATSYVTIWGPGNVCNSVVDVNGNDLDAGTLHAFLRGSPGATYTVSAQIDVDVSTTATAGGPQSSATITDMTGTYTPALLGNPRTTATQSSDNFSMAVTLTVNVPLAGGDVEMIVIRPTMAGAGGAGTAYFTGTIYVSSAA